MRIFVEEASKVIAGMEESVKCEVDRSYSGDLRRASAPTAPDWRDWRCSSQG